ncbi:tRNA/rRNA methyltransferase (SpoU) [Prochlorococcus marinus str. MIT 9301]|uniref:tRNA/rRNA methyltransferase (SpoU) n=1 Tax=Prochlorococcus marinus (strain MIT 9301) TaxID=167546 RepID=A3PED2_PROM0|nr:tRNA/rRNA methyltransferase (SpoU) [Prochlorococcus marinus str. MIT 9301]
MLKSGNSPSKILVTEKWLIKNQNLSKQFDESLLTLVSEEVLASAISTVNPDGIAALVEISSIPNYQFNSKDDFILVLDRIQDPGNMGNLFRTALAAGVDAIFLAGGAHPLNQKVLRASTGAVFNLPFKRYEGTEEEIINSLLKSLSELSNEGFKIFSTSSFNKSSKKTSKPYWEIDWTKSTVLILGNEGQGIHKKIQEAFNETITIPHSELVESLNVACVAVPLLLERKRVAYTSNK